MAEKEAIVVTTEAVPLACLQPSYSYSSTSAFFKDLKWSPDGNLLLSSADDNSLSLFDFSSTFESAAVPYSPSISFPNRCLDMKTSETVYDYCWYPFATRQNPASFCFVTAAANLPLQLFDASTGYIRASYRSVDHCDRLPFSISVAFTPDGSSIVTGGHKETRLYDLHRPGSNVTPKNVLKSNSGVVSCVKIRKDDSGLMAVATFSSSISFYDLRYCSSSSTGTNPIARMENAHGKSGLTQLDFTADGWHLVSAARMNEHIKVWDLRKLEKPLRLLERNAKTNQRLFFDLMADSDGIESIVAGDLTGHVNIVGIRDDGIMKKFKAHDDSVSAVRSCPIDPKRIASCSGQRHFYLPEEEEFANSGLQSTGNPIDNSIKLWLVS